MQWDLWDQMVRSIRMNYLLQLGLDYVKYVTLFQICGSMENACIPLILSTLLKRWMLKPDAFIHIPPYQSLLKWKVMREKKEQQKRKYLWKFIFLICCRQIFNHADRNMASLSRNEHPGHSLCDCSPNQYQWSPCKWSYCTNLSKKYGIDSFNSEAQNFSRSHGTPTFSVRLFRLSW